MSFNGDPPTLDDVRSVLEREGRRPVLLYIEKGSKRPLYTDWEKTTYEQTQSPSYQRFLERHSNTGVLLGVTDDLCAIDCDTESFVAEFIQLNPSLASTLLSVGESGGQFWVYITGPRPHKVEQLKVRKESPLALGAKKPPDKNGLVQIGEFRAEGGQSVIRGIHPCGAYYQWLSHGPPIVLDFAEINWPPDVIIPWGKERRSTQSTTGNKDDDSLLKRAIDALSVDTLWSHFNYPARNGNPVCSPFREDRSPSFSIYDEGRRFKDHGNGDHGDSFDFFQRATGQDAKAAFVAFIELAGLGDELKRRKKTKRTAEADEEDLKSNGDLPTIMHPQSTYVSDFAFELGAILKVNGFYQFHGRAVQIREVKVKARNGVEHDVKKLIELSTVHFSTLIENFCRPLVVTETGKIKKKSISVELSGRTLVCIAFLNQLPEIKLWTYVRTPTPAL